MNSTVTIENLAASLRLSEERERATAVAAAESARLATTKLAAQDAKISRLTTFLQDAGIDSEVVLEGYWMHNAARILRISVDDSSEHLSHVPDQERAAIVSAAQKLLSPGEKG